MIQINNTKAELARLIEVENTHLTDSARAMMVKKQVRYHEGRRDGLHMALETVDLAERSQAAGEAVELRTAEAIMAEMEAE